MAMQIRRTVTANNPPSGLAEGQLAVEMASTPPKLWVGVPVAISSNQRVQLNDFATQAWVTSQIAAVGSVPTGGTQYQALIKGAGTAFGWADIAARETNTVAGQNAFNLTATGLNNTVYGRLALNAATGGANNVAIGAGALQYTNAGSDNVGLGSGALFSNYGGINNCAIGSQALGSTTNANNTVAIGYQAGRYQADGTSGAVTPTNSIFIGSNVRSVQSTAQTNQIVIGADAIGRGNNTVTLGNDAITQLWCGGIDLLAEIAAIKTHVGL